MNEKVIQARQDIADLKQSIQQTIEKNDAQSFQALFTEFMTSQIQEQWNFATKNQTKTAENRNEFIDRMLLLTIEKDAGDILKVFHQNGVDLEKINIEERGGPIQYNLIQAAAQTNAVECIQALHDLGLDADLTSSINDSSALQWAVPCQNVDAFEKLLEFGADPNRVDSYDRTVLDMIFIEVYNYNKNIHQNFSDEKCNQLLSHATDNARQMIDLLNQHGYDFERKYNPTKSQKEPHNILEKMKNFSVTKDLEPYWRKLLGHTEKIMLDKKVVVFAPRSNVREP